MRTALLLLLLANLAFFAYRSYVAQYVGRDSSPAAQQIRPEKIRLIPPAEYARIVAARRANACLELGPVASGDAARAEEAITALGGGLKVASRRNEDSTRWWVYIPPFPTRQAAAQREAELKKRGVDDSSLIIDDSNFRNAISLGVFRSEDAANGRVEALKKLGVADVAIVQREGTPARVYLQLRNVPEPLRRKLLDVRSGFPGSDLRDCPTSTEKKPPSSATP
jgi:hypothetical protein